MQGPSSILAPPYLSSFQHDGLKFIAVGRYTHGIAGEKEKVIVIQSGHLLIASLRGTTTRSTPIRDIHTIHVQKQHSSSSSTSSTSTLYTDIVLTLQNDDTVALSLPTDACNSFLGVLTFYCLKGTATHEVSEGSTSIYKSIAGINRANRKGGVMGSLVTQLKHVGKADPIAVPPVVPPNSLQQPQPSQQTSSPAVTSKAAPLLRTQTSEKDVIIIDDGEAEEEKLNREIDETLRPLLRPDGETSPHNDGGDDHSHSPPTALRPQARRVNPEEATRRRFRQYASDVVPVALQRLGSHQHHLQQRPTVRDLMLPDEADSDDDDDDPTGRPMMAKFADGGQTIAYVRRGEDSEERIPYPTALPPAPPPAFRDDVHRHLAALRDIDEEVETLRAERLTAYAKQNSVIDESDLFGALPYERETDSTDGSDEEEEEDGAVVVQAIEDGDPLLIERARTIPALRPIEVPEPAVLSDEQKSGMRQAVYELGVLQRSLLAVGSAQLDEAVREQLLQMTALLQRLSTGLGYDVPALRVDAPCWALVDNGELNSSPNAAASTIVQLHRLVAVRPASTTYNEATFVIGSREQWLHEPSKLQLIPLNSLVCLSYGIPAEPRPMVVLKRLVLHDATQREITEAVPHTAPCLTLLTRIHRVVVQCATVEERDQLGDRMKPYARRVEVVEDDREKKMKSSALSALIDLL